MVTECGSKAVAYSLWYKLPGTTMERGLFDLETDDDVMIMCALVNNSDSPKVNRYVELYVCKLLEGDRVATQEEIPMSNPFPDCTQQETEEHDLRIDSDSDESWHSDASNKDDSDDDLLFDKNVDKTVFEDDDSPEEIENDNDHSDDSSVYVESDEERMAADSSDEEGPKFVVFNEEVDMERPVFELRMLFKSSKILRKAVRTHAILERRPIELVANYGRKIKYVCQSSCEWKLYASPFNKSATYQIRSLMSKHTCMPTFHQKQINSVWLAEHYEREIRMNPTRPVASFHKKIFSDLKCEVSKHAVYRAKNRALLKINGTHQAQFAQVWDYAYEVKRVLPDSTVKILCEDPEPGAESGRFLRMYICLGPLKKAFVQYCGRFVGLDGCHLKGPFGGQLLAAIGVDANDGMYPIAWAVVESETSESWTWFLELLTQDLRIQCDGDWTFICDRQKGLINALELIVPNAEHRFYVMHLYQNMHKEFKDIALRQLLWKAARSTTDWEFDLHMNKMKEIASKCHEWLMAKSKTQWTRSSFRTLVHSDMFVNNHCEVFNSSIRQFRDLPIITMFRELHKSVMKMIQVRRDKMAVKEGVICPSALKKLQKAIHYAGNCVVAWSGGTKYLVTCTDGGHELVVDLEDKSCTYRKWNLTGISCYHACACITVRNEPWENHIHDCYSKDIYMKLYYCTLDPIVGPEFWQQTSEPRPLPPNVKTPAGRPKKKRTTKNDIPKDPTKLSKVGTVVNCTYCKARGHNKRTCPAKRADIAQKATEEGNVPTITKSTCVWKTCHQPGHNSRTCTKQQQPRAENQHDCHGTQGSTLAANQGRKQTPKRKR